MLKAIHGHEIMQMMIESKEVYSKDSLEKAIVKKFGTDARFYTCSAENMTAREIISLLESKNKFIWKDNGFTTHMDNICNH